MSDEHHEDTPSPSEQSEPAARAGSDTPEYFAGEEGRSVPKAAWWVLAVALAALLVFFLVRPAWFTQDVDDHSLHVPANRHFAKSLGGAGHADGIWLTDDSPSVTYVVTLPADSARSQTRLHLTGTSQIAANSTVFLAVAMDGQQVYNSELPTGDSEVAAYIDVPNHIAEDGQVRIQLRAEGTRHEETCTPDHSPGLQVHLDPATVVEAALEEPVHTVRDAVVSWDRDVSIVLADTADPWRTTAAQLGMALTRAGHQVTYTSETDDADASSSSTVLIGPVETLTKTVGWSAPDTETTGAVVGTIADTPVLAVTTPDGAVLSRYLTGPTIATADSSSSDPAVVSEPQPQGNEVALEALGADMSLSQITETRRWRISYSLSDLPGGRLPQAVTARFELPASPDDLTWILNANLNGTLVGSRKLNATAGNVTIPLPPRIALLDNTLTLSVERDRDLGGCNVRVTSYPIQLQSSSTLDLGADPGAGFTAVPQALAPGFAIYIPDPAHVEDAAAQLNAIVPTLTKFVPAQYTPEFQWGQQPTPGRPFILIGQSPDVDALVTIRDGRLVAGPQNTTLNVPVFSDGLVVETATSRSRGRGLLIQFQGDTGTIALPDFGRHSAQVITRQGSFTVNADGTVEPDTQARQTPPR